MPTSVKGHVTVIFGKQLVRKILALQKDIKFQPLSYTVSSTVELNQVIKGDAVPPPFPFDIRLRHIVRIDREFYTCHVSAPQFFIQSVIHSKEQP